MPVFSQRSKDRLATCDPRLVEVMNLAIKRIDFSILEGHRDKEGQDKAFATGKSKVRWPNGKHNKIPAKAVDILPYPFKNIYWNQPQIWADYAKVILECARELGYHVRWGGDWNENGEWRDERFFDGPHFELMGV